MPIVGGGFAADSGYWFLDRFGSSKWFVRTKGEGSPKAVAMGGPPRIGRDRYVAALLPQSMLLTAPLISAAADPSSRFHVEGGEGPVTLFPQAVGRGGIAVANGEDTTRVSSATQTKWLDDGHRWSISHDGTAIARVVASQSAATLQVFRDPEWKEESCTLPIKPVRFNKSLREKALREMLEEITSTPGVLPVPHSAYKDAVVQELSRRTALPIFSSILVTPEDVVIGHFDEIGEVVRTRYSSASCRVLGSVGSQQIAESRFWEIHQVAGNTSTEVIVLEKRARR
jgi:hypothetical protein